MELCKSKTPFVGRGYEMELLKEAHENAGENASLVVVYGRRRVGKTRLITEFYRDKNLWKFDGIEGVSKERQIKNILERIGEITGNELYRTVSCPGWIELLKTLDHAIASGQSKYEATLFLDELPYMAGRQSELIFALKWAWDNLWSKKSGFTLVLCGSIASFMVKKVVRSSSLYGRIKLEICLKPLSVPDVFRFFDGKKSMREICDLYMFCGGIPEYLLQIRRSEVVSQNIARLAFCKDGYFVNEFDRIFKDIFSEERIYKRILSLLSRYGSLKVPEISGLLKVTSGGGFVEYMDHLEMAGFVSSIHPVEKSTGSKLKRYRLDDEYVLFYFKFIHPALKRIRDNTDLNGALSFFSGNSYKSWAGFAFERLCLKHAKQIMRHLKIDQLVKEYGSYFDRSSNHKEGVQIDLMFTRHDPVITVCELKYHTGLIGRWIIEEVEKKVRLLNEPVKSVEKILITTNGATQDLIATNYFSRIVLIDELFGN